MTIKISGYDVLIDDEDIDRVKELSWHLQKNRINEGCFYFRHDGKDDRINLHRYIMGCVYGDKLIVDHINGDTLDNRKSNLRICTFSENTRNRKRHKNNKSGVKGVCFHKASRKWIVQIRVNKTKIYLGIFENIEDAKNEYKKASELYHKDFGRIDNKEHTEA
jgi:hypothetical protein